MNMRSMKFIKFIIQICNMSFWGFSVSTLTLPFRFGVWVVKKKTFEGKLHCKNKKQMYCAYVIINIEFSKILLEYEFFFP